MAKGFVNYAEREDMQEDTYKIIAGLVFEGAYYRKSKDLIGLFTITDTLYDFVADDIKKNEDSDVESFGDRLSALEARIWRSGAHKMSDQEKSRLYLEARALWRECLSALRKAGLLFKMKADLDNIL